MKHPFRSTIATLLILCASAESKAQCSAALSIVNTAPVCAGSVVQFTDMSQAAAGDTIDRYIWDFGDFTDTVIYTPWSGTLSHVYQKQGDFNVQVYMFTKKGCIDNGYAAITIRPKPIPNFLYEADVVDWHTIYFTDTTYLHTGGMASYGWNFGDGNTSTQKSTQHNYSAKADYWVKHWAVSNFGCTDTVQVLVPIDSASGSPEALQSNMGTDFWAGFGYEERMRQKAGDPTEAKLSLYIAAGRRAANVVVSLPGIPGAPGFPKTVHVPADSVVEIGGFPTGDPANLYNPTGLPDARLYFTGITGRAVHITSTQPVAAWEHVYASNNAAAASLLLPTRLWGTAYTVQAKGGKSNSNNPNSFFFVMAAQDSTPVQFTPANDIVDSSTATIFKDGHTAANVKYQKGSTYTIVLNKGQVFNAMGFITGTGQVAAEGLDLSGSKIVSLNPLKKIAVFGGNGRLVVNTAACANTTGSDNLIQQMFPLSVWGTRYLTSPVKTMEYGIYRVTVSDPATVVKWNGNILPGTSLIGGSYYQVEGNAPALVEADKKVMLTQYSVTSGCPTVALGNGGLGDPEMINLSPLQFAINGATVFSPGFKNGATLGANFINVIIRKEGVASFTIDNSPLVDTGVSSYTASPYGSSAPIPVASAFKTHPADANYVYASFKVAAAVPHRILSDSSFVAIAYGMASGESYGFNAGFSFPHVKYTFYGSGNWSDPANWMDGKVPPSVLGMGTEIIIAGDCTLDVPVKLEEGAIIHVMPGIHFVVLGNLTQVH